MARCGKASQASLVTRRNWCQREIRKSATIGWSIISEMGEWTLITYLQAGAYAAIMAAVLGVPQMISSYFDLRARRLQEERQEERRREERRQDEEHRRQNEERLRQSEERLRQDNERRHQELMAMLAAVLSNGRGQGDDQGELIRTLQQTIEELRVENERLRLQNGNGSAEH